MTTPHTSRTITQVACGDTLVVTPRGEIDLATVGDLSDALAGALRGPWRTIAIDLAETTFLGIVGSHPIENAADKCERGPQQLIIARPRRQARWLLEWLGLGESIVATEHLPPALHGPSLGNAIQRCARKRLAENEPERAGLRMTDEPGHGMILRD